MASVSVHQPDLLPYAGYWAKRLASDVHIVMAGCPFSKGSNLNRVKMGPWWATLPLDQSTTKGAIADVRFVTSGLLSLYGKIKASYQGRPYFHRLEALLQLIAQLHPEQCAAPRSLFHVSDELNLEILEILDIDGKDVLYDAEPMLGDTTQDRLFNLIQKKVPNATSYYSGAGGTDYLMELTPMPVLFPKVKGDVPDESILRVICEQSDPVAWLLDRYTWGPAV